jgi:hypothetical protein
LQSQLDISFVVSQIPVDLVLMLPERTYSSPQHVNFFFLLRMTDVVPRLLIGQCALEYLLSNKQIVYDRRVPKYLPLDL